MNKSTAKDVAPVVVGILSAMIAYPIMQILPDDIYTTLFLFGFVGIMLILNGILVYILED